MLTVRGDGQVPGALSKVQQGTEMIRTFPDWFNDYKFDNHSQRGDRKRDMEAAYYAGLAAGLDNASAPTIIDNVDALRKYIAAREPR